MADSPRLSTAILGSRFGRRLFIMFCLAALLPAAAVFWMTYRTATDDAETARRLALREGGKNFALSVFERLQMADQALATAAADGIVSGEGHRYLSLYFSDVVVRRGPAPGAGDHLELTHPAVAAVQAPSRLRVAQHPGARPQLLHAEADRVLVGTLNPAFLWGDPTEMSQGLRICMYAGRTRLFCGGHPGTDAGDRLLVAEWNLFLKAGFGAEPWTAVVVAGPGHGLAHYRGVLVPAAVAVLLFAMVLSSVQIRRVLVPLSDLLRRIQGFQGDRTSLVRQAGEDEFGLLSRTFERMQQRIGRQIDTLRMLSDVERLILQGAPLSELLDQVSVRMRQLTGGMVCILVPDPNEAGNAALFALQLGAGAVAQVACADAAMLPAASLGQWHRVDRMLPGCLRDACERSGMREAFVLTTAQQPGNVQVVLGFETRPGDVEDGLLQATELAKAIPVAVAFEAGRQRLLFQARHDPLTQLPNRLATFEAVDAAIEAAGRSASRFAVAFLDLDRFKSINDGLGHASGDALLVAVGQRIRDSLSPGDLVGRFGGDEFCVLLAGTDTDDAARRAMQRIVEALARPVHAAGREFVQGFSAGVAFYPEHGRDASTLIRNADVAMYHGKREGGRTLHIFVPEMKAAAQSRLQLEQDLRQAIAAAAIEVHYQPRVDSRNGRIVGVEALARWTHPRLGPIPPPRFIALAEDTGLIDDLGRLVLRKVCAQLAQWKASGLSLRRVAVNVSSLQLRSRRLGATLRAEIDAAGIVPEELEVEITESMLVQDRDAGEQQLQEMRGMGVAVAVDDFGTGYSSLAYLAELPFDTLKIDRAFVQGMGDGTTPMAAIVRMIIGLAHALGKDVIAEGVETMAEVELLGAMGCHMIQGYVFHRPLPAGTLMALLRAEALSR